MAAKNLRQFEFKLGKLGIVLFLIGFTILVFAGFLLGVQVGRNLDTYPEWLARGIPRHILELVGPHGAPARRDIPVGKVGGALFEAPAGDSQAGKPAEGEKGPAPATAPAVTEGVQQANETAAPSGDGASAAAPPQAAKAPAGKAAAPAAASGETVKKEKSPPEAKAEGKKEKEAPAKNGRFTVQVVSFREKEKAEGLSKKIRSLGYSSQVAQTDISGKGKWYRVTVEGFETKPAAEKAAEDMTSKIKGLNCVIKGK